MANAIYPKFKEAILSGAANSALGSTGTNGLWCALIDLDDYTYDASHQFYSSLAGVISTAEIPSVTVVNGVVKGGDTVFITPTGDPFEAVVLFRKNPGANTTWRLVCFMDTSGDGVPLTPDGSNITVTWAAAGIFTL
jgi:hypothetical protein